MKAWGSLLFGIPSTLIFLQRQVKYKRTTELLWFSRSFVFHKASESNL
ncbi:hypothetical protein D922_00942 [Enterococcus faecalis 06-MB-DW-09]|nr:hypothetical protein D922_00942 [Enterococcus faecalis 06-MB-DW-09]